MGSEQTQIKQRTQPAEQLDQKLDECLVQERMKLSHQTNVWNLVHRIRQTHGTRPIRQLHLDHNMIAGEVIEELSQIDFQRHKPQLRVLTLSTHLNTHASMISFVTASRPSAQHDLPLSPCCTLVPVVQTDHNKIAADGCYYLSKTLLPQLQSLDLSHNLINENGSSHLSKSVLPRLVNLVVSHNQLTVKSLRMLGEAAWLSLAHLDAKNNAFEPRKELDSTPFKTEVRMFRLELE